MIGILQKLLKRFLFGIFIAFKLQLVGLDSVDNYALNQGHSQITVIQNN